MSNKTKNPFAPNFENTEVGDEVFSIESGNTVIGFNVNKKYPVQANGSIYTMCGFHPGSFIHPSLFNSLEQCKNYFAWEFEQSIKEPKYELAKDLKTFYGKLVVGSKLFYSSKENEWVVYYDDDSIVVLSNGYTETKESAIKRLIESGIVREVGR